MIFSIRKKTFTIVEMMLVVTMIAIWMMGILSVIDYGIKFSDKTRKNVIAINIARSWIEQVFNIRDTNWLRWSAKKYQCWLKTNPMDDWWDWNCENDIWMWSWSYMLSWKTNSIWQQYFLLSWTSEKLSIKKTWIWNYNISTSDKNFAMCNKDWFWYNCPGQENSTPEWRFFMMIKWSGLFDKSPGVWWASWSPTAYLPACIDWQTCWNDKPMEYRFCSLVQYVWNDFGEIELCSIMTNFEKQE